MYVIKSGTVRLTKRIHDAEITLEEIGSGAFCGELAMVTNQPRTATATVIKNAAVIQIAASQFENMLRSNSDIAVRMMKKMTQRLTQAQYRLANFTLRTTKGRLMHQLRHEVERANDGELRGPAPIPDNLSDSLGIEVGELKRLLSAMVRDELITVDKRGDFQIVDPDAYDRQLQYLELHDRFEYDT
jgi:CRP-like cAMP-binding protein